MAWGRKKRWRNRRTTNSFSKTFGKYGLHHEFGTKLSIDADSATPKNTVVIPLLACDSTMANPDSIYVNPRNSSKTTSNDHLTYGSSVVKKIHYQMQGWVNPAGTPSTAYKTRVYTMPICAKYDDLTQEAGGDTVSSFIPLVEHGSDEKLRPNWSGNDLDTSYTSDCWDSDGLTTDAKWEQVTWDLETFETALAESPLNKKLLSMTEGGLRSFDISKEYPQTWSGTLRVPKKVQLQTEHVFYGILIHIPDYDQRQQYYQNSDLSNHKSMFNMEFSFYEFNKEFNQNVS